MTIPFKCTVCGFSAHVEDAMGGKAGKCPKCQTVLKVQQVPVTPASPEKSTKKKRTWMERWDALWAVDPQELAKENAAMSKSQMDRHVRSQERAESARLKRKNLLERSEAEILTDIQEQLWTQGESLKSINKGVGCLLSIVVALLILSVIVALIQADQ